MPTDLSLSLRIRFTKFRLVPGYIDFFFFFFTFSDVVLLGDLFFLILARVMVSVTLWFAESHGKLTKYYPEVPFNFSSHPFLIRCVRGIKTHFTIDGTDLFKLFLKSGLSLAQNGPPFRRFFFLFNSYGLLFLVQVGIVLDFFKGSKWPADLSKKKSRYVLLLIIFVFFFLVNL